MELGNRNKWLKKIVFLKTILLFTIALSSQGQIYVENYEYASPGLDASKWNNIYNNFYASFDSAAMNIYRSRSYGSMPLAVSFGFSWYKTLTLSESWTAVQRFKANDIQNPDYLINMQANINGNNYSNYFSEINGYPVAVGSENILFSKNQFHWFGLSYDSNSKNLIQVFSDSDSLSIPQISDFTATGIVGSFAGSENLAATLSFNGSFLLSSADINFTNLNIVPYSVPEPSALSLLAVGLGGLAVMRRRRS